MTKKQVPYLCGGTFFMLIERAVDKSKEKRELVQGKQEPKSNKALLASLIRFLNADFSAPSAGRTFDGDVSDYRKCSVSAGTNLPFHDDVLIDAFDTRIRKEYSSTLKEMDLLIEHFFSTQKCEWLCKAVLSLIETDRSIPDNDCFYALENGSPIRKDDLITRKEYALSPLLLGTWHYIITRRRDNESKNGKDTFLAWNQQSDVKGKKWTFISPIGKEYPREIRIEYFRIGLTDAKEPEKQQNLEDENPYPEEDNVFLGDVVDEDTGSNPQPPIIQSLVNNGDGIQIGVNYGKVTFGSVPKK